MGDKDAFGPTLIDTGGGSGAPPGKVIGLTMRSTVLPRGSAAEISPNSERPRYEPIKLLGRGGVGEVTLVQDNDIHRPVAVKRLRPEVASEGLHRFVHEIRTVGQLEHPNIAPIHDVGIDDAGNHYFVMRYVEGETLEAIIAKLAAGDAAYHARFTFEHRVQVFLGIVNAVNFAHAKGIIHRDLKPANIMVGPFGEVVVMDWGIAKKVDADRDAAATPIETAATLDGREGSVEQSLFRTRHGTLIGTPAYMSPEQAAARVAAIDQRSDVYSACAVFYELLALRHYLPGRTTVQEMLASVQKDVQEHASHLAHPHQGAVPAELGWFLEKGLAKDPAARYQSMAEMIAELQRVLAGGFAVRCYVTFMKKTSAKATRYVDSHPRVALGFAVLALGLMLVGLAALVLRLV